MKTSRKTAGATLVLTVLVVMLVLAAVVAVTAQLAISARRTSADQDATVQSQYVAESGVARAEAQLRLINNLMGSSLKPDATVTTSQMLTWMYNLCGVSVPSTAQLTASVSSLSITSPMALCNPSNGDVLGNLAVGDLANASNLNLFTAVIPDSAYAGYGYNLSSLDANPATAERKFWAQSLKPNGVSLSGAIGGSATTNVQSSVGVTLKKVERFGLDSYRLTFTLPDVVSTSTTDGAGRKLSVEGVSNEYSYEISRGSFAKYALFTNHHFADASSEAGCASSPSSCNRVTFTSNTLFSGPVHSNQNFLIQGTPYFAGQITSAGCPPGQIVPTTDSTGQPTEKCNAAAKPGAFFQSTTLTSPAGMQPNANAPVACSVTTIPCPAASIINPQFQGGVNWTESFQPLPKNANNQAAAALNGGISLSGTVDAINLSVGTISIPGSSGSGSGSSTNASAQLISYTQNSLTTQLAVTQDKRVYIKVGSNWKPAVQVAGVWIDASLPAAVGVAAVPFNGVLYASGTITSLKGPARTTASDPNTAPPAVAAFSQLTVAATGAIHIKGDLKYESPPCTGSNSVSGTTFTAAPCTNTSAQNILGIYSSGGDVDIDSPAKYGTANGTGKDVTIQAVLMASSGRVTVDGYDQGTADPNILGQVRLLGGIIENYYGPFGITDGHGYGRNYVYDPRTGDGLAPPSFPTQQTWSTDFKKTTDSSGTSVKTPLELEGSQTQQKVP